MAAPRPSDAATAEVVRLLREAAARCVSAIRHPPGKIESARTFAASRAAQQLAGLNRELDAVGARVAQVAARGVAAAYQQGLADAERQAAAAGVRPAGSPVAGGFSVVDRRRAGVLADQTVNDLRKSILSMRETTGKVVRQTQALNLDTRDINRLLAGGSIEGKPRETLRRLRDLVRKAAVEGKIVTVNTRTGVEMHFKPATYADLVMQTKSAETTTAALMERLRGRGLNYVKVIGSASRRFCTAFVNRVFWIGDGEDPTGQFPSARMLPRGGPPFHPRCTKRFVAFNLKLASPAQVEEGKLRLGERELLGKSDREAQKNYSGQTPNRPDPPPAPGRVKADPTPAPVPADLAAPPPVAASALVSPPRTGRLADDAREVLQAIDAVHRFPRATRPIPLQIVSRAHFEGQLKTDVWIMQLRGSTVSPRSTLAHEIGHYVEHQVLGEIGQSAVHPAFDDWRQAIAASPTFQRVRLNYLSTRTSYSAYLATPYEVFARSYAQWIAQATSDVAMLGELRTIRLATQPAQQWDYEEFLPIAAAFDLAFDRMGLQP